MSSGFIRETDLEEARKKRQEEWEKVRKADEPEEAPEEPYDSRSLFERLEENKRKKQEEWDKEHDIKNVARGIDDDEAAFLDKVDDVKAEIERKKKQEERQELDDYRKMKEKLLEESEDRRLKSDLPLLNKPKQVQKSESKKQAKMLIGAVKVKKRDLVVEENKNNEVKSPKKAKSTPLGALAGLGSYISSSDEES